MLIEFRRQRLEMNLMNPFIRRQETDLATSVDQLPWWQINIWTFRVGNNCLMRLKKKAFFPPLANLLCPRLPTWLVFSFYELFLKSFLLSYYELSSHKFCNVTHDRKKKVQLYYFFFIKRKENKRGRIDLYRFLLNLQQGFSNNIVYKTADFLYYFNVSSQSKSTKRSG